MPKLINTGTGELILPGAMLRSVVPGEFPGAWRFESITPHRVSGEHHLHVTRYHRGVGRAPRLVHPRVFGCHVILDLAWHQVIRLHGHRAWAKVDDYLWAGAFALVPLAFFERFDMGARITELVGMGKR